MITWIRTAILRRRLLHVRLEIDYLRESLTYGHGRLARMIESERDIQRRLTASEIATARVPA